MKGSIVNMTKKITTIVCIIFLSATIISVYALTDANHVITIGLKETRLDNPIYLIDDRTYVPIRDLCDEMGIPVLWDSEKEQVKLDINNKRVHYRDTEANAVLENGVIPNAETAKVIAKTIFETCMCKSVEYTDEDGYEFYLNVSFSEEQNSWLVYQDVKYRGNSFGGGNVSPIIRLNRATGEVMGINLEQAWDSIIEEHKKSFDE